MPSLLDLPNEILDELMEYLIAQLPPSQLRIFLFSRQLNPSAIRAIYRDIRFLVNSDSQMVSLKHAKDKIINGKIRSDLLALDLLAGTASQSPHLFGHTRTVHLRIFETYSRSTRIGSFPFSGVHASDPIFAETWAESVVIILRAVPAVEHLVCDWFMDMEGVSVKLQQLSKLRTLQLRGIRCLRFFDSATRLPSDLVLPAELELLSLRQLSFNQELNFQKVSNPSAVFPRLKFEAIDCHSYAPEQDTEPESEFWSGLDSDDDDVVTAPINTTTIAKFTEARIAYSDFHVHTGMPAILNESDSSLDALEFLDNCQCTPLVAEECYPDFERFTNLQRLSVSLWNVPLYGSPNYELKNLTHLRLHISLDEIFSFTERFEEVLESIQLAKSMPKLESIRLSTRHSHKYGFRGYHRWEFLLDVIHSDWSDKSCKEFCGWTKASYAVKRPKHEMGIYKFACGIELDITDILDHVGMLKVNSKQKPLSTRLTTSESLRMAV
ncbi:hypothetical protein FKW77_008541 [Venturia effusa]|uniref:Uncharacterized protein n=1 Tax=Venturia effusa TaxID=50376 RepID=A0A517L3X6_9PEZI|nr:hypothetical protein FKW77_008541 [Venturia effusa]